MSSQFSPLLAPFTPRRAQQLNLGAHVLPASTPPARHQADKPAAQVRSASSSSYRFFSSFSRAALHSLLSTTTTASSTESGQRRADYIELAEYNHDDDDEGLESEHHSSSVPAARARPSSSAAQAQAAQGRAYRASKLASLFRRLSHQQQQQESECEHDEASSRKGSKMKFSHTLLFNAVPEWTSYYIK